MNQNNSNRIVWLMAILAMLAVIASGAGDRLVTHWAFAAERGRIRAGALELARVEEVSNAFRLVANVSRPAVVHINVSGGTQDDEETAEELQRLRRMFPKAPESQLRQFLGRPAPGSGSGVIIDARGYILTNNHVVGGRENIEVKLSDERVYPATLVGADPKSDLAVIKIDAPDLHQLEFGDSDAMEVGDWVLAVGAPFGLSQTVTHGIISAKGRSRIQGIGREVYQDFLQTDAAVNPGNSGGPLLNLRGQIIGINTAIATHGEGNAGIAFTIPSKMAQKVATQLMDTGEVTRGWLGVSMTNLDAAEADVFGLKEPGGVLVEAVIPGTPADDAGLAIEDVITQIDGNKIRNMEHLRGMIADIAPGKSVKLDFVRDGRPRTAKVVLAKQPRNTSDIATDSTRHIDAIGLRVRTLRPNQAELLGLDEGTRGVLVYSIDASSENAVVGFSREDVIVGCNGKPVKNVGELERALRGAKSGKPIEFRLAGPDGAVETLTVQP